MKEIVTTASHVPRQSLIGINYTSLITHYIADTKHQV